MSRRLRVTWIVIVVASIAISALLFVAVPAAANVGAFAMAWGLGVGGLLVRFRVNIQRALGAAGLSGYFGFAVIVIAVSVIEETVCMGFGCTLAVPNYALDLFIVTAMWLTWLSVWYFVVAPRFAFSYEEALLVAACAGVLFETVNGRALADPLGSALGIPLVIVVYAGIVALPIQLMPWTGAGRPRFRHAFAFFVPYLVVLPVAVQLFVVAATFHLLP